MPVRDESERILRELGEPTHFREIYRILAERGIEIRGKDPARTLGAQLSADHERFYPIGANTGKWALVEWKTRVSPQASPESQDAQESRKEEQRTPWGTERDPWDDELDGEDTQLPIYTEEPRQLVPFDDRQRERVAY